MSEELSAFLERFHDYQHRTWAGALPTERDALAATFEKLELDKLEGWFTEDLKCESRHYWTGAGSCSVEVTHLVTTKCAGRVRVCAVSAAYEEKLRASGETHMCDRPYPECVGVHPI